MCRRINIFIPVLFVSYIAMSMLIGIIIGVTGVNLPLWVNYILGEVLIVLPAFIYVILFKINIIKCMPYRKIKVTDGVLSLLIGYMLIPLVLFVSNLTTLFSTNYLQDSMSELTSYPFLVQLFLIAVVPAVVEEFVFRGLIYHSYRKNGILGAAVLSAVVFGFMHLNINQLSYALIMGVVFALMVEVTGSMYSSMLAHFAVNSYSITMLKLLTMVSGESALTEQSASLADFPLPVIIAELIFLAVLAIGFLGIAFLLFKKMAVRNGRWDYLICQMKKGIKPQNGESFLTAPLLVALITVFIYMIQMEIF